MCCHKFNTSLSEYHRIQSLEYHNRGHTVQCFLTKVLTHPWGLESESLIRNSKSTKSPKSWRTTNVFSLKFRRLLGHCLYIVTAVISCNLYLVSCFHTLHNFRRYKQFSFFLKLLLHFLLLKWLMLRHHTTHRYSLINNYISKFTNVFPLTTLVKIPLGSFCIITVTLINIR